MKNALVNPLTVLMDILNRTTTKSLQLQKHAPCCMAYDEFSFSKSILIMAWHLSCFHGNPMFDIATFNTVFFQLYPCFLNNIIVTSLTAIIVRCFPKGDGTAICDFETEPSVSATSRVRHISNLLRDDNNDIDGINDNDGN
jgi:hypothetical protein